MITAAYFGIFDLLYWCCWVGGGGGLSGNRNSSLQKLSELRQCTFTTCTLYCQIHAWRQATEFPSWYLCHLMCSLPGIPPHPILYSKRWSPSLFAHLRCSPVRHSGSVPVCTLPLLCRSTHLPLLIVLYVACLWFHLFPRLVITPLPPLPRHDCYPGVSADLWSRGLLVGRGHQTPPSLSHSMLLPANCDFYLMNTWSNRIKKSKDPCQPSDMCL